jgi:hypothetical protein
LTLTAGCGRSAGAAGALPICASDGIVGHVRGHDFRGQSQQIARLLSAVHIDCSCDDPMAKHN